MSIRLVEGASEGCRPKLPRWPFSGSSCTHTTGTALDAKMVGSPARRVKLFSAASHIFLSPSPTLRVLRAWRGSGDFFHTHRDPQALAGSLSRKPLSPALLQLPALTIVLRALVCQETRAQKHRMLAILLAQRIS